jgi:hypothetical protein
LSTWQGVTVEGGRLVSLDLGDVTVSLGFTGPLPAELSNLTELRSLNFANNNLTGLQSGPGEIFDLGLTYSSSSQITLLFGLNISSNLKVGYAYNQSFITGLYPNGTHELMLEYRIPSRAAAAHFEGEDIDNWYH